MPACLETRPAAQFCTFRPDRFYFISGKLILGLVDTNGGNMLICNYLLVVCFHGDCFTEYLVRAGGINMFICRLESRCSDSVLILFRKDDGILCRCAQICTQEKLRQQVVLFFFFKLALKPLIEGFTSRVCISEVEHEWKQAYLSIESLVSAVAMDASPWLASSLLFFVTRLAALHFFSVHLFW
jgi:hypothetical protein